MQHNKKILLAFYGDDFTGSTDALEFITRAGAKTVLFTEVPTNEQLKEFPGIEAFGVAGKTRALSPDVMEQILLPAFEQMKTTGARHVHYKVCSTFDSSPKIGSIGKAIDCGAAVFDCSIVPVLGGMPLLGRYCLFGNLFAQMGIGSKGKIYRLDRHPSMSKHPVTPAGESDLLELLNKQTDKKAGLINVLTVSRTKRDIDMAVDDLIMNKYHIALFDVLTNEHLTSVGEHLDEFALDSEHTLFTVGSSGIEAALGNYWNETGLLKQRTIWESIKKVNPILVISGSCSPVTATQIAYAKSRGFEEVIVDVVKICNDDVVTGAVHQQVNGLLQQGKNVMVHTGQKLAANLSSEKLGTALGCIAKQAVKMNGLKRVLIAGGDTSSYAARAMEIDAVEMIAPFVPGAPLCKAYSKNENINGLEVNFKGGQVGSDDYFVELMNGEM